MEPSITKDQYLPESWKIDPANLSDSARELWERENNAPISVDEDHSLRPKILDACGMACVFCHNEGTPVVSEARANSASTSHALGRVSIYASSNGVAFIPGRMHPNQEMSQVLTSLQQAVGIKELHLTGGEPTLHPELSDIIDLGHDIGLKVKMTSNGENPKIIEKCAVAGLDRVIFSIFGTTADELSQVQHPRYQNSTLAQRKIDSLHRSINIAGEAGLSAAANVVVPGPGHEQRVTSIVDEFEHLSLRLLNSLDQGGASYAAIYEILATLDAEPVGVKLSAGSSNTRTTYLMPNGSEICFKQIRPARFGEACDDCEIDAAGKCEEGFYGLRLYVTEQDEYLIGMCIQRMDIAMGLDEFLQSGLPEKIMAYRRAEKQRMEISVANINKTNEEVVNG